MGVVVTPTREFTRNEHEISKMRCLLVNITAGFLDMQFMERYARNICYSVALGATDMTVDDVISCE